jgi:geranylgeranyl diphosphate synthase, type II
MPFSIKSYIQKKRQIVEKELRRVFSSRRNCPPLLWKSMKYSVFAGGKRLRPILCLASAGAVGLSEKLALRIACAIEMIHTYSLIHDDLPALDDDDYRRGRKTNHKVFGDAMAILAGDGLQTLAFEWIANSYGYPSRYLKNIPQVVMALGYYAGYPGMVGGQVDDILSEKKKPSLSRVFSIHRRKTGALLLASVRLPAVLAGTSNQKNEALTIYGTRAGLAFQIVDDILNETGNSKKLGKAAGSDRSRGKMTYPSAIGLEKSRREVERLTNEAVGALRVFGKKAEPLVALALHMAKRSS